MIEGVPSRTAFGAALHRAVHQVVDSGRVFPDPMAVPITGWSVQALVERADQQPGARPLRAFIAMRHAFARDVVAASVADGVRQVVVLGAGLDTTAYQPRPPSEDLHVVEVDHPATQAWKREVLADAGITPTVTMSYAAVDFETQSWVEQAQLAGLDPDSPSVVVWLGVVPYLSLDAVRATLTSVAGLAPGSALVLDYGEPRADGEPSALESRVAGAGEPFRTRLTAPEMQAEVRGAGLALVDDLGVRALVARFYGVDVPDRPGGHLLWARTPSPPASAEAPDQRW